MNPKQLRDSISQQCGFTPNKASGTVKQGRRPMFKPFPKDNDDTCPKCGSSACTHIWELDAQQGEPTSFSAWLEANQDSIDGCDYALDQTEATAQWFDNKAKEEGSPFA